MFADGSNGSVELADESITIRRKGFANVLTQGIQGDKQIPLTSITAVQFRSAGSMMAGLIQFSIVGGREFRGGMLEATRDENAVMFTREQEPSFAALRNAVQGRLKPPNAASAGGSADEIERLASLYEKGHLTQQEFTDAKRRILSGQISAPAASQPALPTFSVALRADEGKGGCLKPFVVSLSVILGLLMIIGIANPGPKWGEPGYKPRISDKCRSVWASINVTAAQYIEVVCTADERHEIEGARPK